jgi:hypothetical protein
MNTAAETLLAFWKEPRNIPFKRSLISEEPPKDGENPTTCMCAQGQALYMIGGYTEEDLRNTEQSKADKKVAELLGISVAHSILLRQINDCQDGAPSDVLTNPEKYLGKNYQTVLNFWTFMDSLSEDQWKEVASRYNAIDHAARAAAWDVARDAASTAARAAAGSTAGYVSGSATYELIGGIENPVFVPLFDNLDT